MPAGYSFRPRLWALAAAALGCAAFIALGNWQTRRADEKRALGAQIERVGVTGTFVPKYLVLLDNKVRHGRRGYEVIMPLALSSSDQHVLIDRGWIEVGKGENEIRTPAAEVRVEGIALPRLPRVYQLEKKPTGPVRQTLDIDAYAAETGLKLRRVVIEQHSALDDGLLREWPQPDLGVEKHESYALQWYSFAALAVILAVVLSFRKT